jgi:hypothetical protein
MVRVSAYYFFVEGWQSLRKDIIPLAVKYRVKELGFFHDGLIHENT